MKLKVIIISACLVLVSANSFAENRKTSMEQTITVKQQLEVMAIDHKERWAKLKDRSGFTRTIHIGDEVKNFDQVVVGDIINVNFAETIQIKAYGADAIKAGEEVEVAFAKAAEGQKPGKAIAVAKTIVVTISAIDLEHSLVTLSDKQGNTKTFSPQIPSNLKKVKVGDKVAISIAKALAITVKPSNK